ncbi:uncharacterized protein LOC141856305 [Brevipalpus obovatus]|uniref:uncharacterized protein LOC141856305 n=1 Tax=Brevipalpus obovatus TaxID=246614 RepID=UPI003D9EDC33
MEHGKVPKSSVILVILIFLVSLIEDGATISCFKCTTKSGRDKACDRGLSSAASEDMCKYRPQGRQSFFPGVYCVKIEGYLMGPRNEMKNERVVIRDCDERPFSHPMMSAFTYHGMKINGTAISCKTDYCNNSPARTAFIFGPIFALLLSFFFSFSERISI